MTKYLSIFLLSMMLCCGEKVRVVESTAQEWVGGLRESGYGTEYVITVKVKAGSEQLQFEDLWAGENHLKVRVIVDPKNLKEKSFKKGSLITVRAGLTIRPDAEGQMKPANTDSSEKPLNFTGEGLLGYSYKGQKAYLEISEFKKLEKLIYP
ncbi:MAG: hypothetical protein PHY99_10575 [Bacteroidales bacterium]|nr:hypothetical protein [Bacteroidales bacterium]